MTSNQCVLCSTIFSNVALLSKHYYADHDAKFHCEWCFGQFRSKEDAERHEQNTHVRNASFTCVWCQFISNNRRQLIIHQRENHTREWSENFCQKCDKILSSKEVVEIHDSYVHRNEIAPKNVQNMQVSLPFRCQYCSQSFSDRNAHCLHTIQTHSVYIVCSYCDKHFETVQKFESHLPWHRDKKCFKCIYCQVVFNDLTLLKAHQTVAKHNIVNCPNCKVLLPSQECLQAHRELEVRGVTPNSPKKSLSSKNTLKNKELPVDRERLRDNQEVGIIVELPPDELFSSVTRSNTTKANATATETMNSVERVSKILPKGSLLKSTFQNNDDSESESSSSEESDEVRIINMPQQISAQQSKSSTAEKLTAQMESLIERSQNESSPSPEPLLVIKRKSNENEEDLQPVKKKRVYLGRLSTRDKKIATSSGSTLSEDFAITKSNASKMSKAKEVEYICTLCSLRSLYKHSIGTHLHTIHRIPKVDIAKYCTQRERTPPNEDSTACAKCAKKVEEIKMLKQLLKKFTKAASNINTVLGDDDDL